MLNKYVTHISQKIDNDTFIDPIPIGVRGSNVKLNEGVNLEIKLKEIAQKLKYAINHRFWEYIDEEYKDSVMAQYNWEFIDEAYEENPDLETVWIEEENVNGLLSTV